MDANRGQFGNGKRPFCNPQLWRIHSRVLQSNGAITPAAPNQVIFDAMIAKSTRLLIAALFSVLLALGAIGAEPANYAPTFADVRYGKYDRDVLDFFRATTTKPAPVLIYYHGGGWIGGDKKSFNPAPILKAGISVVAANYRFTTGTPDAAPYPAPMLDSARVVQFVRSKAEEWHIDPQRIALTGSSAGAVIAMWIGYRDDMANRDSQDPIERFSTRVTCLLPQIGPTTLDPKLILKRVGGPPSIHPALPAFFNVKSVAELDTPEKQKLIDDASALNHVNEGFSANIHAIRRPARRNAAAAGNLGQYLDSPRGVWPDAEREVRRCRRGKCPANQRRRFRSAGNVDIPLQTPEAGICAGGEVGGHNNIHQETKNGAFRQDFREEGTGTASIAGTSRASRRSCDHQGLGQLWQSHGSGTRRMAQNPARQFQEELEHSGRPGQSPLSPACEMVSPPNRSKERDNFIALIPSRSGAPACWEPHFSSSSALPRRRK